MQEESNRDNTSLTITLINYILDKLICKIIMKAVTSNVKGEENRCFPFRPPDSPPGVGGIILKGTHDRGVA